MAVVMFKLRCGKTRRPHSPPWTASYASPGVQRIYMHVNTGCIGDLQTTAVDPMPKASPKSTITSSCRALYRSRHAFGFQPNHVPDPECSTLREQGQSIFAVECGILWASSTVLIDRESQGGLQRRSVVRDVGEVLAVWTQPRATKERYYCTTPPPPRHPLHLIIS